VNPLRAATACRGSLVGLVCLFCLVCLVCLFCLVCLECEHEVHGLARRGAVETPLVGQRLDQEQAAAGLCVGGNLRPHWQRARRVVHVDAKPTAGAGDGEHDGLGPLTRLVPDGVGHQLAGQQEGGVQVDGNLPGPDGVPDLAAGFGRRGRSRGQPDAAPVAFAAFLPFVAYVPFGRAGRRHRGHRVPSCAGPAGPGGLRPDSALLDVG